MLYRIEAGLFPHLDDTIGRKTAASIREALGIPVKSVRTIKVFTLEGLDAQQVNTLMAKSVLHDPVLQAVSLSHHPRNLRLLNGEPTCCPIPPTRASHHPSLPIWMSSSKSLFQLSRISRLISG